MVNASSHQRARRNMRQRALLIMQANPSDHDRMLPASEQLDNDINTNTDN